MPDSVTFTHGQESKSESLTVVVLLKVQIFLSIHPYRFAAWYSVNSRCPASLSVKVFQLGD